MTGGFCARRSHPPWAVFLPEGGSRSPGGDLGDIALSPSLARRRLGPVTATPRWGPERRERPRVDGSVEGARPPLGLILLLEFLDAPGSDWDPKELRKRSPLLVWGEMRLAPEARAGRTAFAARTPNRPGRAEGPNAAIALPWALVSPQRPQVVYRSLSPPSRCTHSASFSF